MLAYVGSGDYCFANSLHMSLLGSGAPSESLPSTGFLECLTTLPFGYTYLKDAELFFFSGPNPDLGLTRAIATLGWECPWSSCTDFRSVAACGRGKSKGSGAPIASSRRTSAGSVRAKRSLARLP